MHYYGNVVYRFKIIIIIITRDCFKVTQCLENTLVSIYGLGYFSCSQIVATCICSFFFLKYIHVHVVWSYEGK